MSKASNSTEHTWVQEVLPWFVNQSLSVDEQARVEAHLSQCACCREDIAREQQLAEAINQAPVVAYAPQHSLQKLMQVIDKPSLKQRLLGWLPAFPSLGRGVSLANGQWFWPSVVGAQALAVAVLAVVLSGNVQQDYAQGEYYTLSSGSALDGHLQVVFDDSVSAKGIGELLSSVDGSIIQGPSNSGLFLVAVPSQNGEFLNRAAAILAEQEGVRFVAVKEAQ